MTTDFETTLDDAGGVPNRRVTALGILAGIVVLYVVSPPVAWLCMKAGRPGLWELMVEVVYAPLKWLNDRIEVVREFYDWQSRFFRTVSSLAGAPGV